MASVAAKFGGTAARMGGKMAARQVGKQVAKQAAKQAAKRAGKQLAKRAGKQLAKKAGKQLAKKAGKQVAKKTGKQLAKKAGKQAAKKAGKQLGKKAGKQMVKKGAKKVGKKAVKNVTKKSAKNVTKKSAKKATKKQMKKVMKKVSKLQSKESKSESSQQTTPVTVAQKQTGDRKDDKRREKKNNRKDRPHSAPVSGDESSKSKSETSGNSTKKSKQKSRSKSREKKKDSMEQSGTSRTESASVTDDGTKQKKRPVNKRAGSTSESVTTESSVASTSKTKSKKGRGKRSKSAPPVSAVSSVESDSTQVSSTETSSVSPNEPESKKSKKTKRKKRKEKLSTVTPSETVESQGSEDISEQTTTSVEEITSLDESQNEVESIEEKQQPNIGQPQKNKSDFTKGDTDAAQTQKIKKKKFERSSKHQRDETDVSAKPPSESMTDPNDVDTDPMAVTEPVDPGDKKSKRSKKSKREKERRKPVATPAADPKPVATTEEILNKAKSVPGIETLTNRIHRDVLEKEAMQELNDHEFNLMLFRLAKHCMLEDKSGHAEREWLDQRRSKHHHQKKKRSSKNKKSSDWLTALEMILKAQSTRPIECPKPKRRTHSRCRLCCGQCYPCMVQNLIPIDCGIPNLRNTTRKSGNGAMDRDVGVQATEETTDRLEKQANDESNHTLTDNTSSTSINTTTASSDSVRSSRSRLRNTTQLCDIIQLVNGSGPAADVQPRSGSPLNQQFDQLKPCNCIQPPNMPTYVPLPVAPMPPPPMYPTVPVYMTSSINPGMAFATVNETVPTDLTADQPTVYFSELPFN